MVLMRLLTYGTPYGITTHAQFPQFGPLPQRNRTLQQGLPIQLQLSQSNASALHGRPRPAAPAELVIPAAAMPLKRKKWTEEEERALIDKYAEMQSAGTLRRLRTREKKFRPIAAQVNAAHHAVNPVAYPFLWSWKDASTKVQNMRHQYLLVKQKLLSALRHPQQPDDGLEDPAVAAALDWSDGLSLWPNFLHYKHVFGDAPLKPPDVSTTATAGRSGFPVAIGADEDGDLGLGFDVCGGEDVDEEDFDYEEVAPPPPPPPLLPLPSPPLKKRTKKPERARLAVELTRLREWEARMEEREAAREQERRQRELAVADLEEAREREQDRARRDAEEGWRRRREEDREWEERMEGRRAEWRERMEGMLSQHRVEMENIHARILQDQQNIMGQLLGIVSHWAGPGLGPGLSDATTIGAGIGNHHQPYISQMIQNLHHMNVIIPGENRGTGDGQEDQFIVDE